MAWETAVVLSLVGAPAIFLFAKSQLDQTRHPALHLFMMLLAFLFVDVLVYAGWRIADLNDTNLGVVMENVFAGVTWVMAFITIYFIVMFAIAIIHSLQWKSKKGRVGDSVR